MSERAAGWYWALINKRVTRPVYSDGKGCFYANEAMDYHQCYFGGICEILERIPSNEKLTAQLELSKGVVGATLSRLAEELRECSPKFEREADVLLHIAELKRKLEAQ